jgi:hypothetical protein
MAYIPAHIPDVRQFSLFAEGQKGSAPIVREFIRPVSVQAFDSVTGEFSRDRPQHGQWVFVLTAFDLDQSILMILHPHPKQNYLPRGDGNVSRVQHITGVEISGWKDRPSAFASIENPFSTLNPSRMILATQNNLSINAPIIPSHRPHSRCLAPK